eukprot:317063-Lingulodinium_polyedra.AAC.1
MWRAGRARRAATASITANRAARPGHRRAAGACHLTGETEPRLRDLHLPTPVGTTTPTWRVR